MKKISLKERQNALRDWCDNFCAEMSTTLQANRPKMLFINEQLKDGDYYVRLQCERCGCDTLLKESPGKKHACPHCNNSNTAYTIDRSWKMFYKEINDGWIFVLYGPEYRNSPLTLGDITNVPHPIRVQASVDFNAALQYSREYGFLLYAKDPMGTRQESVFISTTSPKFENILLRMQRCDAQGTFLANKIDSAKKEIVKKQEEAFRNKTMNKSQASEMECMRYNPKDLDMDALVKAPKVILYDRHTHTRDEKLYTVTCTVCGTNFHNPATGSMKCPTCGNEITLPESAYKHSFPTLTCEYITLLHYENTGLSGNEILLRVFNVDYQMQKDGHVDTRVEEVKRFFLGRQKKAFDIRKGKMVKGRAELTASNHLYQRLVAAHTKEELYEIFANSELKYSGAMEAMSCCESVHKPITDINSLNYIQAWYQNPGIELVYKSQLRQLARECLAHGTAKLQKGKNVKDVLGVTNIGLQIMRQFNLGLDELESVRDICQSDPTLTVDGFQALRDNVNLTKAAGIMKDYHVSWKDVVEYINSVYMHQCIEKDDAMSIWGDYLNMATTVGFDLSSRSKKFPSSLRKEHDIAMFAYKAVKADIDAENFLNQALQNKERYAYEYGDLVAIVPESVEAVIQEATNQHNCLRSYVEAIKNGRTAVAFIRRKDASSKSYVSVEVKNAEILQVKGFANSSPRCEELTEFLEHWCKDKCLRLCCSY